MTKIAPCCFAPRISVSTNSLGVEVPDFVGMEWGNFLKVLTPPLPWGGTRTHFVYGEEGRMSLFKKRFYLVYF